MSTAYERPVYVEPSAAQLEDFKETIRMNRRVLNDPVLGEFMATELPDYETHEPVHPGTKAIMLKSAYAEYKARAAESNIPEQRAREFDAATNDTFWAIIEAIDKVIVPVDNNPEPTVSETEPAALDTSETLIIERPIAPARQPSSRERLNAIKQAAIDAHPAPSIGRQVIAAVSETYNDVRTAKIGALLDEIKDLGGEVFDGVLDCYRKLEVRGSERDFSPHYQLEPVTLGLENLNLDLLKKAVAIVALGSPHC